LRHEYDIDNSPLDDAQLCPGLPTLNLTMHMHGFVLVAVEEDHKAKIFVELGHEAAGAGRSEGGKKKLKC
jgi:hypothetical protein